jgi:hypothetical protein
MFFHVILQLDHRYFADAEDIKSPSEIDPYIKLRNELEERLSPSIEQRIRQLLKVEKMGARKPSQFPSHLKGLEHDVPEDILRTIWSSRLPPKMQTTLAGQQECSLDAVARCAERISEETPSRRSLALFHTPTPHFYRRSMTSPARWRHSAPSRTVYRKR